VAYSYGYQEVLSIPLDEIYDLLPDAIKIYEQKLAFLGLKKL